MFNLARMTGYWDPEFKPSIYRRDSAWTIDDMWRFSQFAFFGELVLWGDSPILSSI